MYRELPNKIHLSDRPKSWASVSFYTDETKWEMRLRIALVVPNDRDLWNFRRHMIKALVKSGVEVLTIAPQGPYVEKIRSMGCVFIPWTLDRRSFNPLKEFRSLVSLYRIYRKWRPIIAHHFTIKPNFYGILAARIAGVPIVLATVTGLGYLWTEESWVKQVLSFPLKWAYKAILRLADKVLIFNEEDLKTLGQDRHAILWPGEGVDMEWSPEAAKSEKVKNIRHELGLHETTVILMVARMLRHKGVFEFAQAARLVRQHFPETQFLLVGPVDQGNPASLSQETLRSLENQNGVRWLGMREDIRELMALSDVLVLPSYYREGIPQVLLEGAAMGKPLVATDIPGCREVVQDGINGFLIPPKDPQALAEALEKLLKDPGLRDRFGQASRALVEEKFASRKVVAKMLRLYAELLRSKCFPVPPAFMREELE